MNSTEQRSRSVWMTESLKPAPPLPEDLDTDVAVIGAGLGGLTTAYLLAREGRQVVVVDSGAPGGGMTARTTAHLTCALDDRWYELIALKGEASARLAADAHAAAIDFVESLQRGENIACDFARVDGYLVPAHDKDAKELLRELEAAHQVGLTGVALLPTGPLTSYAKAPVLKFPRQARFHPLKYLKGLVAGIARNGGRLFTAHVAAVEDGLLRCADGRAIRARTVVIATNSPINDKSDLQKKQAPYRSYVIAGPVPKDSVPDMLLWDTGWPYHYMRLQPGLDRDLLIVGGEDHKTGTADDMHERLARLDRWTRKHFPMLDRITARWSGQVMETRDYLGYLGRYPGHANTYMITGDSGQGMTHATIGARIIADAVQGRANPWALLFDPARPAPKDTKEKGATTHLHAGGPRSAAELAVGAGAVFKRGGRPVAAYRAAEDRVVEMSAVCTHMGCEVAWNPMEGCWDCPCHGSQFSAEGVVINGPAAASLGPVPEEKPARASATESHARS